MKVRKKDNAQGRMSVAGSVFRSGRKGDGVEVKDGCLSVVVVPKGEVERK